MLSRFPHTLSGKCFLERYDTLGFRYGINRIFTELDLMSMCETRENTCWAISKKIHFGEISKNIEIYVKQS